MQYQSFPPYTGLDGSLGEPHISEQNSESAVMLSQAYRADTISAASMAFPFSVTPSPPQRRSRYSDIVFSSTRQ